MPAPLDGEVNGGVGGNAHGLALRQRFAEKRDGMGGKWSAQGLAMRDESRSPLRRNRRRKPAEKGWRGRARGYLVRDILLFFPYYLLIVCFAAVSLLFRFCRAAVSLALVSVVVTKGYDCRRCFAAVSFFNHPLFAHFRQKPEHARRGPLPRGGHEADGMAKLATFEVNDMPPRAMATGLPCGFRDEPYERLALRKLGGAEGGMVPHGTRNVERASAHSRYPLISAHIAAAALRVSGWLIIRSTHSCARYALLG